MFCKKRLWFLVMLLGLFSTSSVWAEDGWEQIDASDPFVDRNGVERTPSCSGGPQPIATPVDEVPVAANTDFSFFIRRGDPKRLAIFWDGGGACWDANTCVGSAWAGDPIYDLEVEETIAELDAIGGIADRDNPANPIANYTQVFIPYCTADLHAGAKDTTYFFTTPDGTTVPWTIYHRGFDNVVAVLEWLTDYYENDVGRAPSDVFLAGASAGGYGVLFNYPAVDKRLPRPTRIRLLSDSAIGVINQDFYDRALTPSGVWGVWENLAPELANAIASGPDTLAIELNQSLGWNYPRSRFGQYTRAFDAVQVFYYNVTRNLNAPELWTDPAELLIAGLEWTLRARAYMQLSALTTWNYRFYLGQGLEHTILADDSFYLENSAQDVLFSNWVDDMINHRWPWRSDWRNVSCAPNCLP